MLSYLAYFIENEKGLQVSRYDVQTEDEKLALGYIMHHLINHGRKPWTVFRIEGSGNAGEEHEKMRLEDDFPPNKMVYLCPELSAMHYLEACDKASAKANMHIGMQ